MLNTDSLTAAIIKGIKDELNAREHLSLKGLKVEEFVGLELLLFLLENTFTNESPMGLWVLLCRYELNVEPIKSLTEQQKNWIAKAAYAFPLYRTRSILEDNLNRYRTIESYLRLYEVSSNLNSCSRKATSFLSDRHQTYERFFNSQWSFKTGKLSFASPGQYSFDYFVNKDTKKSPSVEINEATYNCILNAMGVMPEVANLTNAGIVKQNSNILNTLLTAGSFNTHDISGKKRQGGEIVFAKNELLETAKKMDALADKNYVGRINDTDFELLTVNGKNGEIKLQGTTNAVGIVSSGKSTVAKVLSCNAAKRKLHTTIVLSDVLSVLSFVDELSKALEGTGIKVAPILGKTSRETHALKLHFALRDRQEYDHKGMDYVTNVCLLDYYQIQKGSKETMKASSAPCSKLQKVGEDGKIEKTAYHCPFYYLCPSHQGDRDLVEASIWVTTFQALLYTNVPKQLLPHQEQIKYGELVNYRSDIVIIDESDKMQPLLDDAFSPSMNLASHGRDAFFHYYSSLIAQKNEYTNRGHLFPDRLIENFQSKKEQLDSVFSKAWSICHNYSEIQQWIDNGFFTSLFLLNSLADDLTNSSIKTDYNNPHHGRHIITAFLKLINKDVLSEDLNIDFRDLAFELLRFYKAIDEKNDVVDALKEWLICCSISTGKQIENLESTAQKLYFALAMQKVGDILNFMLRYVQIVANCFEPPSESIPFSRPPEEFQRCVPAAPLGSLIAFNYIKQQENRNKPGRLDFIKSSGLGRWFLLNFSRLFEWNQILGPRVLLMSGTSWCPQSSTFHLQKPVDLIIKPSSPDVLTQINNQSNYKFDPARRIDGSAIRVSGAGNKKNALKEVVRYLCDRDSESKNSLEKIRDDDIQDDTRRRLLLLVGSYDDAEFVKNELLNNCRDWSNEDIYALTRNFIERDGEDAGFINPGALDSFVGNARAWILIAPMQAIERGHNILNNDGIAAFGAALFLVRPHPVPDSPELLMQMLNCWTVSTFADANFFDNIAQPPTLDAIGREFRARAREHWFELSNLIIAWSRLPDNVRRDLAWSLWVLIVQVTGRLVRGKVGALVYFVDPAFAPESVSNQTDTPATSLLTAILEEGGKHTSKPEFENLYSPFYEPLKRAVNNRFFAQY